jgi:hypothetical protein
MRQYPPHNQAAVDPFIINPATPLQVASKNAGPKINLSSIFSFPIQPLHIKNSCFMKSVYVDFETVVVANGPTGFIVVDLDDQRCFPVYTYRFSPLFFLVYKLRR